MVWVEHLEKQAEEEKTQKKKYNSKKYNDTFRQKHADILKQKINCSICHNDYTYYTKSKHMKTKKHIKALPKPEVKPEVI